MKLLISTLCGCLTTLGAGPMVSRTVPTDGATEVDPGLGQVRIEFDQPMDRSGWSLTGEGASFPLMLGKPWWDDDRVFVWRWRLQPGHSYSLNINAEPTAGFVNPAGDAAPRDIIRFTTQGEASATGPNEAFRADLRAFFQEVDGHYPFFELKQIRGDWEHTKQSLETRVGECASPAEFLGLVSEAMRCLRDSHLRLIEPQVTLPAQPLLYYPGVSFMPATEGRVVVMATAEGAPMALRPGAIVTHIDGRNARDVLEEHSRINWSPANPFYVSSPQRARLYAWRLPLAGAVDDTHVLRVLSDGDAHELRLVSHYPVRGWPHTYNLPQGLSRVGRSAWFALLDSGTGYVYLRRVDSSSAEGLREAVKRQGGARGWIVDLRGNSGGGYGEDLLKAVRGMPRPVVVLIDSGCISAGETLARDFRRYAGAHLMGERTAGASSSKRHWRFPSGLATVVFSVRSRWRADGRPIEFLGIEPDTFVEAEPMEVAAGQNSEILRAEALLEKSRGE